MGGKVQLSGRVAVVAMFLVAGCQGQEPERSDQQLLQGVWQVVALVSDGKPAPREAVEAVRFTFAGDVLLVKGNYRTDPDREESCPYVLGEAQGLKTLDFTPPGEPHSVLAIYELNRDRLRLCLRHDGGDTRPTGCCHSFVPSLITAARQGSADQIRLQVSNHSEKRLVIATYCPKSCHDSLKRWPNTQTNRYVTFSWWRYSPARVVATF